MLFSFVLFFRCRGSTGHPLINFFVPSGKGMRMRGGGDVHTQQNECNKFQKLHQYILRDFFTLLILTSCYSST